MPEDQQVQCRCGQFYDLSDAHTCPNCGLRPRWGEPDVEEEWAIFTRSGELHRGPWTEEAARLWLQECTEMGIGSSTFHLCHRSIGPWKRDESVGAMIRREGEEARIKMLEELINERQTDV